VTRQAEKVGKTPDVVAIDEMQPCQTSLDSSASRIRSSSCCNSRPPCLETSLIVDGDSVRHLSGDRRSRECVVGTCVQMECADCHRHSRISARVCSRPLSRAPKTPTPRVFAALSFRAFGEFFRVRSFNLRRLMSHYQSRRK
jgi:hypothetical protein